jgi:hypothetical protein
MEQPHKAEKNELGPRANGTPRHFFDNTQMPRYFLHVRDGDDLVADAEGSELENDAVAQSEAIASAIDIVCESLRTGQGLQLQRSVVIHDEEGRHLLEIPFELALAAQHPC